MLKARHHVRFPEALLLCAVLVVAPWVTAASSIIPELRQSYDVNVVQTNVVVTNPFTPQRPTIRIRFWPRVDSNSWTHTRGPRLNGQLLADEPLGESELRISPSGEATWLYECGLGSYINPSMLQKPHWQRIYHDPVTPRSMLEPLIYHSNYAVCSTMGYFREPIVEGGNLSLLLNAAEKGGRLTYRIPGFGDGVIRSVKSVYTGGSDAMKLVVSEDADGAKPLCEFKCPYGEIQSVGGLITPRRGPLFLHFVCADRKFAPLLLVTIKAEVDYGKNFPPQLQAGRNDVSYSEASDSSGRAQIQVELVSKVIWESGMPLPSGKLVTTLAGGQPLSAPALEVPLPGTFGIPFAKPEDLSGFDFLSAEVRCDPGTQPPGARLLGLVNESGRTSFAPSYGYGEEWFTIGIPISGLTKSNLVQGVSLGGISQTSPPANAATRLLVRRVWLTRGEPPSTTDHSKARLDAARRHFLNRTIREQKPPKEPPPIEQYWPWGVWLGWNTISTEFDVPKEVALKTAYADLRRNGFNAVFMEMPGLPEAEPLVTQAEKMGIRIWSQGPQYFVPPWTEERAKEFYTPEMERSLADLSRALSHRWGLLSFEFVEEIGEGHVPLMHRYYELLDKYFPNQPGVIVHNSDPAFRADLRLNKPRFSARDHYPFRLGWDRRMYNIYKGRLVESARAAAQAGTRWWLVAQSCYSAGDGSVPGSEVGYWGYTVPTTPQVLLQVWTGIGLGAKGIWFYDYLIPSVPMSKLTNDVVYLPNHSMEGCCFKNYDGSDTPQWLAMGRFIQQFTPHLPLLLKSTWMETDAALSAEPLIKTYTHSIAGSKDRLLVVVNEDWDKKHAAVLTLRPGYENCSVRDLIRNQRLTPEQLKTVVTPPGEGLLLRLEIPSR